MKCGKCGGPVKRNGHTPSGTQRYQCKVCGVRTTDVSTDPPPTVELPVLPEDDIPTEQIIDMMVRRFEKRDAHQQAKKWMPIQVREDKPIGLMTWGDPHLDDNGTNWPLLKEHVEIAKTPGIYSMNIGDVSNNWVGSLMRLYAEQDTSRKTAQKLADWFLNESGISWLVWLLGNHDMWNAKADTPTSVHRVLMEEWGAQFKLVFPNKREFKIHAAHDFPGNSMWNSLHGPQKAAHMREDAHLYICGHKHNWALHQEESASKGFTYWLARARGYKYIDMYAEVHGHASQREGASIMAVFDPHAISMAGALVCFADVAEGAEYLKWKRKKAA